MLLFKLSRFSAKLSIVVVIIDPGTAQAGLAPTNSGKVCVGRHSTCVNKQSGSGDLTIASNAESW